MRVLITGGMGLIGHATAQHLQQCGLEVRLTDLIPGADNLPGIAYTLCDIMDFDSLLEQMRGCDAVVHLAALRNPFYGPGQDIFRINAAGTFNVFEAAAKAGIQRVIQASSINALGCAWNLTDFSPQYLPVDEDHPGSTTDPYSFSKQQVEAIGAYYWRRDGISSIALRFPGVYEFDQRNTESYRDHRAAMLHFLDEFVDLPREEQQRQLTLVQQQCRTYRAGRPLEYPAPITWKTPAPEGTTEHLWRAYTFDRFNLWTSLDVRDAARAIEQALTANFTGSSPLFVNDDHNSLDYDSSTLAALFFADIPESKRTLNASESLVSIQRARDLIGFQPLYSVHGAS